MLHYRFGLHFVLGVLLCALVGCGSVPSFAEKPYSAAIPLSEHSALAQYLAPELAQHPQQTGVIPLGEGLDAFVARLALIQAADVSVDLQYYIYRSDNTGKLLALYLLDAANRGVRVRLLLDDMTTADKDEALVALTQHANVDVRVFNPVVERDFRNIAFMSNFGRLNHRMHNKSLTVDNIVTVVGGRNIGDEYYSANEALDFGDLDLMATGDVVSAVSKQFDEYWNAPITQPIETLSNITISEETLSQLAANIQTLRQGMESHPYIQRLKQSQLLSQMQARQLVWFWGDAQLIADPAQKYQSAEPSSWVINQLKVPMGQVNSSLILISPYFVPSDVGSQFLVELAQKGMKITIITNGLASTDVLAVHAGYQQYRQRLLAAGIAIYETKSNGQKHTSSLSGSSKSSLHAKTFIFDDTAIFVGSFNFDPRSAILNTEMGIFLQQPSFASLVVADIHHKLMTMTYRLALQGGDIVWHDDETAQVFYAEPEAGFWRKFLADLLALFPIEAQL